MDRQRLSHSRHKQVRQYEITVSGENEDRSGLYCPISAQASGVGFIFLLIL